MKLRTDSLRFRFIASTFLWIAVSLILTGVMVTTLFRTYISQHFHNELRGHLAELDALTTTDASGQPYLIRRLSDPRFGEPGSGFYWEVCRQGFRSVRSASLGVDDLPTIAASAAAKHWTVTMGPRGQTLEYGLIRQAPDGGAPIKLIIASDIRLLESTLSDFERPLVAALAAFALFMLLTGAAQIAYGLRPLRRIVAGVADIRAGRKVAMTGDYPAEIRPLANDLNVLLATNTAIVQRGRAQAANLAHGLRTPLAIMLDEAERLADRGETESAAALKQECQRMLRQISYHLARARAAAPLPAAGGGTPIHEIVTPVAAALRRLYANKGITITCSGQPDVKAACDPVDLGEIISNVLDNACKWASAKVEVSWSSTQGKAKIVIDDDGPGITEADRKKVFAIGERLDAQIEGSGLGLAITRDLMMLYHGNVELGEANGGGLRVALGLPLF